MITRRGFIGGGLASLLAVQYAELFGQEPDDEPDPEVTDSLPVREAIARRRTVRRYRGDILSDDQVMAILWAAQGVTDTRRGLRSAPSAGALYPLDIYLFTGPGAPGGRPAGIYRYLPEPVGLETVGKGDRREELARACLSQMWVAGAPAVLVISSVHSRVTGKYGQRGVTYAAIEAGCAAQNVFLMAAALGLSAGIVGAFQDGKVRELTGAGEESTPLLVMPFGNSA